MAITDSASVCLPLSLALRPIFQNGILTCATSSQGFGPLTGRLWGIRQVRKEEDEGESGTRQRDALQGSSRFLALPHWESCSVELNDHAWMNDEGQSGATPCHKKKKKLGSQVHVCETKENSRDTGNESLHCVLTLCIIHKSCEPSLNVVFHCVVIDWGRQLVIHKHHHRSIRFSLSSFNGIVFYSLIKWDSTLPPYSHLAVSYHDNQLMHVQTPSGNAPYNNPDKGYGGIQLNTGLQQTLLFTFLPKCKGLTSCGHIFISCSGLFILVGGVYVELSFSVYYTANDRSGSLTPLASFK